VGDVVVALAILVILAVVVWAVSLPLRRPAEETGDDELDELLAEKEAKYREIRDAEMDHRTGKLDEADWMAVDRQLRAEAVAILRRIDEHGGEPR
jgi:flagellar biosynthesis/type III secretory pathway M-ring protein FliF/YscJ